MNIVNVINTFLYFRVRWKTYLKPHIVNWVKKNNVRIGGPLKQFIFISIPLALYLFKLRIIPGNILNRIRPMFNNINQSEYITFPLKTSIVIEKKTLRFSNDEFVE